MSEAGAVGPAGSTGRPLVLVVVTAPVTVAQLSARSGAELLVLGTEEVAS